MSDRISIAELRRLGWEATPGRWESDSEDGGRVVAIPNELTNDEVAEFGGLVLFQSALLLDKLGQGKRDADLAAAARNVLPVLLEAVEAAQRVAPFLPPLHRDALNRYLACFDFGEHGEPG